MFRETGACHLSLCFFAWFFGCPSSTFGDLSLRSGLESWIFTSSGLLSGDAFFFFIGSLTGSSTNLLSPYVLSRLRPQPLFHDLGPYLGILVFYSHFLSGIDWFSISVVSASNLGDGIILELYRLIVCRVSHFPLCDLCLVSSSRMHSSLHHRWLRVPARTFLFVCLTTLLEFITTKLLP